MFLKPEVGEVTTPPDIPMDKQPEKYLERIDEISDIRELNNDHRILHIWWGSATKRPEGWTRVIIKKVHDAVVSRLREVMRELGKEYDHKTPMKLTASRNLTVEFDYLYEWVSEKLRGHVTQEDENLFTFQHFFFAFYPCTVVLKNKVFLILEGNISSLTEEQITANEALDAAKRVLKLLEVMSFRDSDSSGLEQFLIFKGDSGFCFYFSPDFPNGWNENHILPVSDKINGSFIPTQENRVLMPIRPSGKPPIGEKTSLDEFLQYIKPFKIKADFVKLVGSLAIHEETEGDFDILIEPISAELLENIIKFRFHRGLPEEFAERLSFLTKQEEWQGPFTDFVSLGELYFLPKLEFRRVEMQMRAAPVGIQKQAEESKERDSISIKRMFYPMKPVRGAYENQHQTIDNFVELFQEQPFPRLVSKKFDGNTFIFFKDGDVVRIFSDDGLENTEKLPDLVAEIKKLNSSSMIFLAEVELWVDGMHYPRESVRSALSTKFDEWNKLLIANIFELVYVNGRDLHRFPAFKRYTIAKTVFKGIQSTDDTPEVGLNFVSQHVARNIKQLHTQIKELSFKPGSEGVVVKKADYTLDGKGNLDQAAKFHKSAWVNAIVLKRIETKAENIFVYEYGLPHDLELQPPLETTKGIVPIGKTFNTKLKAKPGDLIQIEFETLNFTQFPETGKYDFSLWIPSVIELPEDKEAESVSEAIEKAEKAGILQKKWVVAGETFYDERKVPEVEKEARHRREGTPLLVKDPYMEYPEHGKKMNLMRHAHFRGKSIHFDVRRELISDKWLVGWTENVQIEDAIEEDVKTLEEAKRICQGYSIAEGNEYLKPLSAGAKVVAETKALEPIDWMTFQAVTPPGTVGATKEKEGVLYIIDKGKTEWGSIKSYFREYFDSEGEIFNGRYIVRQLEDIWGITKQKTVWFAWYADDPMPYILTKRAMKKEFMPPDGQSSLPKVIRDIIPEEYHYWKKQGDEARQLRDNLVEADLVKVEYNPKGEIVAELKVRENTTLISPEEAANLYRLVQRTFASGKTLWGILVRANDKFKSYLFDKNPAKAKNIPYTEGITSEIDIFSIEGTIPIGSPGNYGDEEYEQKIIERGYCSLLLDLPSLTAIEFKGEILSGKRAFRQNAMTKDVEGSNFYAMKPSVRFEIEKPTKKAMQESWEKWAKERIDAGIVIQDKLDGIRLIISQKQIPSRAHRLLKIVDDDGNNVTDTYSDVVAPFLGKIDVVVDLELVSDKVYLISVLQSDNIDLRLATEQDRLKIAREKKKDLTFSHITTFIVSNQKDFFDITKQLLEYSQEGILLKQTNSVYDAHESNQWAKVKLVEKIKVQIVSRKPVGNNRWVYTVKHGKETLITQPTGKKIEPGTKITVSLPKGEGQAPRVN